MLRRGGPGRCAGCWRVRPHCLSFDGYDRTRSVHGRKQGEDSGLRRDRRTVKTHRETSPWRTVWAVQAWDITRWWTCGWNLLQTACGTTVPAGGPLWVLGDQAELACPGNSLGAVGCAEFAQQMTDVLFHGVDGDHQFLSDARVRSPGGK